uniref:Retrotransposon protein, putative, unclassified n=1 Tax=Oryza sativa subsp. japonica TaxID=39947 RepID=Q2QS25_ORYSJ|nr:retrotransposon protein, putative, unclassified [Oryza sativa Japonica Group]
MNVDGNPFPVNMVHTTGRTADGGRAMGFQRKYDKQQEKHYEEDDDGFDPHWGCMRLPSIEDCPGCSDIAESSSQSYIRGNRLRLMRVPVHQRLGPVSQDRGQKDSENRKNQWCPSGISTKNQKRRVQRLRNRERFQEVEQEINHRLKKTKPTQEWRVKNQVPVADEATADEPKRLAKGKIVVAASVNMVFTLPAEFGIKQADIDEVEEESAKLILSPEQAVFDKPEGTENRYLKPLYINGYVNGKPMSKMMVDGGAVVNLMPYATLRKLGRNAEDLIKTNMVLKDFGGNPSETKGVLNVELTVGNKTIPTTFFVIDGKGSYSLLLGRDWIHANCCFPSTMHQCLIQWQGDKIEIVPADRSVNVASADLALWEMDGLDCLSGKVWDGDFLKMENTSYYFEGIVEGSDVYNKDTVDDLNDRQGQGFMLADDLEEIDIGPVHVIKKNGKVRVCIDFQDLNKATPKDEYPMPVADQLVDAASGNKILSFMDGNVGYNQIFMAEEDIHKITFSCLGAIGLFEWVVMTFGLKSAGAIYQSAMNYIYHDLIGWLVEVYIDDVVVKSKEIEDHIADLRKFLGFLVHEREIEVTERSVNAIKKIQPSENKTELQEMISKINFVRRFIFNLSGRLRQYLLSNECTVICKADVVKYMFSAPILKFAYTIKPYATNNQAEYEAVLKGLRLLKEVEANAIEIMGDSLLVLPYKLVFGHESILPWEVRIGSRRTELQNDLTADEYYNLMADEREDLVQLRLRALANVTKDKERVARHYNKKVVPTDFSEGELVWKLILPIRTRDSKFGKWSSNWEGPFQIVSKGAYMLQGLDGEVYGRALNGEYLKKYYPSVWVNA